MTLAGLASVVINVLDHRAGDRPPLLVWVYPPLLLIGLMVAGVITARAGGRRGNGPRGRTGGLDDPAVRQSGASSRAGGLPREYHMSRSKRQSLVVVLLAKIAAGLLLVWLEDTPTLGFQIGMTVAMVLLISFVSVAVFRTGTLIDSTGIRIRGIFRTRHLAWDRIREIRAEPLPSSDDRLMPPTAAYVYLTDGSRKRLLHLDHMEHDVDVELSALRAAGCLSIAPPTGRDCTTGPR
ncbi:PH domain-containing protein [Streptomyces erythrochromogenes]|uniref:PH domain-containing protein n=2 Tax=Streptomyces erythrochromogenes TaxID=285574 RepID=UPI00382A3CFE